MAETRCIHGLETRFCAICNSTSRSDPRASDRGGNATLVDVLEYLNQAHTRATYGAVASVLGLPARAIGATLGTRRPEASWIVNGDTGLPTGYEQADWHPDLLATSEVIRTGTELTLRLALSRGKAK